MLYNADGVSLTLPTCCVPEARIRHSRGKSQLTTLNPKLTHSFTTHLKCSCKMWSS